MTEENVLVLSVDLENYPADSSEYSTLLDEIRLHVMQGNYTHVVLAIAAKKQYFEAEERSQKAEEKNSLLWRYQTLSDELKKRLSNIKINDRNTQQIHYEFNKSLIADYYNDKNAGESFLIAEKIKEDKNTEETKNILPCPIDISCVAPLLLHMREATAKFPEAKKIDVQFYGENTEQIKKFFEQNKKLIPSGVILKVPNKNNNIDEIFHFFIKKTNAPLGKILNDIFTEIKAVPEKTCKIASEYVSQTGKKVQFTENNILIKNKILTICIEPTDYTEFLQPETNRKLIAAIKNKIKQGEYTDIIFVCAPAQSDQKEIDRLERKISFLKKAKENSFIKEENRNQNPSAIDILRNILKNIRLEILKRDEIFKEIKKHLPKYRFNTDEDLKNLLTYAESEDILEDKNFKSLKMIVDNIGINNIHLRDFTTIQNKLLINLVQAVTENVQNNPDLIQKALEEIIESDLNKLADLRDSVDTTTIKISKFLSDQLSKQPKGSESEVKIIPLAQSTENNQKPFLENTMSAAKIAIKNEKGLDEQNYKIDVYYTGNVIKKLGETTENFYDPKVSKIYIQPFFEDSAETNGLVKERSINVSKNSQKNNSNVQKNKDYKEPGRKPLDERPKKISVLSIDPEIINLDDISLFGFFIKVEQDIRKSGITDVIIRINTKTGNENTELNIEELKQKILPYFLDIKGLNYLFESKLINNSNKITDVPSIHNSHFQQAAQLYAQAIEAKEKYPDAPVNVTFINSESIKFSPNEKTVDHLSDFFEKHEDLIPKNVCINLEKIEKLKKSGEIELTLTGIKYENINKRYDVKEKRDENIKKIQQAYRARKLLCVAIEKKNYHALMDPNSPETKKFTKAIAREFIDKGYTDIAFTIAHVSKSTADFIVTNLKAQLAQEIREENPFLKIKIEKAAYFPAPDSTKSFFENSVKAAANSIKNTIQEKMPIYNYGVFYIDDNELSLKKPSIVFNTSNAALPNQSVKKVLSILIEQKDYELILEQINENDSKLERKNKLDPLLNSIFNKIKNENYTDIEFSIAYTPNVQKTIDAMVGALRQLETKQDINSRLRYYELTQELMDLRAEAKIDQDKISAYISDRLISANKIESKAESHQKNIANTNIVISQKSTSPALNPQQTFYENATYAIIQEKNSQGIPCEHDIFYISDEEGSFLNDKGLYNAIASFENSTESSIKKVDLVHFSLDKNFVPDNHFNLEIFQKKPEHATHEKLKNNEKFDIDVSKKALVFGNKSKSGKYEIDQIQNNNSRHPSKVLLILLSQQDYDAFSNNSNADAKKFDNALSQKIQAQNYDKVIFTLKPSKELTSNLSNLFTLEKKLKITNATKNIDGSNNEIKNDIYEKFQKLEATAQKIIEPLRNLNNNTEFKVELVLPDNRKAFLHNSREFLLDKESIKSQDYIDIYYADSDPSSLRRAKREFTAHPFSRELYLQSLSVNEKNKKPKKIEVFYSSLQRIKSFLSELFSLSIIRDLFFAAAESKKFFDESQSPKVYNEHYKPLLEEYETWKKSQKEIKSNEKSETATTSKKSNERPFDANTVIQKEKYSKLFSPFTKNNQMEPSENENEEKKQECKIL